MQAIALLLGSSGTRNAWLVSKAWAMMLGQAFRTGRVELPSFAKLDAAAIKRVQRFLSALKHIASIDLRFDSDHTTGRLVGWHYRQAYNTGKLGTEGQRRDAEMQQWATQLSHAALSNALSTSQSMCKLVLHSPYMLPLISYLTLSQLRSLDIDLQQQSPSQAAAAHSAGPHAADRARRMHGHA
jgi:hypothetical protein